jgi:hypothetical protein
VNFVRRSLLLYTLALGLAWLVGDAAAAQAQQFYNPSHYHHTRQQFSNRAAMRKVTRTARKKRVVARRPRRSVRRRAKR